MRTLKLITDTDDTAYTVAGNSVDCRESNVVSMILAVTVASSTADTFVDADVNTTNDTITLTSHGWLTGRKVAATTDGVLPGGLSATDYYVIKVDANTIKLASSLANAQAGTQVDITSAAGGGTHTLTPAALSGASVKLQGSADDITWADIGIDAAGDANKSANITATANILLRQRDIGINYIRPYYTLAAGQIAVTRQTTIKE